MADVISSRDPGDENDFRGPAANTDSAESPNQPDQSRVAVSFHPLGGVGISVRSVDGTEADALLDVNELSTLIVHLTALATMQYQAMYAQAMQDQMIAQKIAQGGEVWTPNG